MSSQESDARSYQLSDFAQDFVCDLRHNACFRRPEILIVMAHDGEQHLFLLRFRGLTTNLCPQTQQFLISS
jgi:hypothetical protein